MRDRIEPSGEGENASAPDSDLRAEMRAALDATMHDLLELRRLVGDAPSNDVVRFDGEGSGRTPEP